MSEEENNKSQEVCKMSDDLIAVIRELVQLSLLTGTNIVDHLRAILIEVENGEDGVQPRLVPTQQYFEAYHNMIDDLNKQAQAAAAAQELAADDQTSAEDVN